MRYDQIWDAAESGNTPGRVFTSSINDEQIIPKGAFLDHLLMGLKGAVSTSAVAIETFIGVLSQYTFKAGAETRIQLSGRQLVALMAFYYGQLPLIWENTDATGNDFVFGIKVPIQEKIADERPLSHSATHASVTNIGTETILIYGAYFNEDKGKKPIHAVAIPYTTAAAAGLTNLGVKIPSIGKLLGLLVQHNSVFADGQVYSSINHIQLVEDGLVSNYLPAAGGANLGPMRTVGVLDPMDDLLKVFSVFDFREDPIDLSGKTVEVKVDVQETSVATYIIPIIERAI